MTKRTCEECRTEIPANAPRGLCPRCLAKLAIGFASPAVDAPQAPTPTPDPKSAFERIRYFGDYELLEEIARGGMGVVYRARQVSLNRIVAVKMLLFGRFSSDEFVKRFHTEAEAVASLQHPNIVAFHEVGEHEGLHYFSMDYVAGKSLAELVRENPLPAKRAASYLKTIAEAIHYAHEQGILHRDLKPSNVLIDELDQPRITDFGLAKQLKPDADLTPSAQMLGSPNYMSPEQAQPKRGKAGVTTDVYSLGAILYHLLTRRPPFQAETLEDTLMQLLNNEPVAPRLLNPSIPRNLETICLKALEREPRRRYATAQALADDLQRFLTGEPVHARPASSPKRLWRWSRRRPALAALIGLLIVVATGACIAAVYFQRLQEKERRELYLSDMVVALHDFHEGDTSHAFELLKRYLPTNGEADLREFEWRYLWKQCRGNYSQWLPEHEGVAGTIRFSPNGEYVAVHTWNNTLTVWNRATRQKLFTISNATSFGGFSTDGASFTVGLGEALVQSCETRTGFTNREVRPAGALVAFADSGNLTVTVSGSNGLQVLDMTTAKVRFALPGFTNRWLAFGMGFPGAVSPDGKLLALIEPNATPSRPDVEIRLWDLTTQQELPSLPANRQIRCLAFSPDGKVLAVGDGDGRLVLWNLASPGSEPIECDAHKSPLLALAFSPDGWTLATGSSDTNCIQLWNVSDGSLKSNSFRGQVGDVWSLAFSADGKILASGTRDGRIRMWNLETQAPGEIVEEHVFAHEYGNCVFSPDGLWLAAGCDGDLVKIWEVATLRVKTVLTNATYVVAFSTNGKSLLVSTGNRLPHWENMETPSARAVPSYRGDVEALLAVDLRADGRMAALGLRSGSIQLLDVESGRAVGVPMAKHIGAVRSLALSPAGDKLASGGDDKQVIVWDVKTGRVLGQKTAHKGSVCAVAISPDGRTLASGCGAETIKFWDLDNVSAGSIDSKSQHKSVIRTLAYSPDGQTLASGSEDNTVKLWNVALRREVASFEHEGHVRLVLFSPDGNALATVTDNGTLRIFRAASLKEADEVTR